MSVVVADDIPETLELVCSLVEEVCPHADIVARCTSLAETKKAIDEHEPEVVLLDIQFAQEGKTAFDLLDQYRRKKRSTKVRKNEKELVNEETSDPLFRLIIFTAHCETEYYDMAFQYEAVHFLPKPIDKFRLKEALERFRSIPVAKQSVAPSEYRKNKLIVNTIDATHFIDFDDIVTLRSIESHTVITLANEMVIKSSRNLGYFELQIADHDNFVRVHNNAIVNLQFVEGISNKTDKTILLKASFGKIKGSREGFKLLLEKFM